MALVPTSIIYLSVPITTLNDVEKNSVQVFGEPEEVIATSFNGYLSGEIVDDSDRAELIAHPEERTIKIANGRIGSIVRGEDAEELASE